MLIENPSRRVESFIHICLQSAFFLNNMMSQYLRDCTNIYVNKRLLFKIELRKLRGRNNFKM